MVATGAARGRPGAPEATRGAVSSEASLDGCPPSASGSLREDGGRPQPLKGRVLAAALPGGRRCRGGQEAAAEEEGGGGGRPVSDFGLTGLRSSRAPPCPGLDQPLLRVPRGRRASPCAWGSWWGAWAPRRSEKPGGGVGLPARPRETGPLGRLPQGAAGAVWRQVELRASGRGLLLPRRFLLAGAARLGTRLNRR